MNEGNTQGPQASVSTIRQQTELTQFFDEVGGGTLASKIERALSDVALGVVNHGDKGKKGKVTVSFDVARVGESLQVNITHKLEFKAPTGRGKKSEDEVGQTIFHVGRGGKLTLLPDTQQPLPLGETARR